MGCRLPKLRKAEERRSPGNIYSTLRRPQVETKVGVAYTYHFLDFLLGKEEVPVSSVLCLSSVRELPVQVRELYAQGFVLVAVHPFVHPCGPRNAHIQRQLHRAVLVRETPSSEKSQLRWSRQRLETDVCVASHQAADPEVIQSYVKRIQDVAEQGVMFVGFLQQPGGGPCYSGNWDPEDLSSLHSSPSPIHRHPFSAKNSPTDPTEPHHNEPGLDHEGVENHTQDDETRDVIPLKPIQSLELDQEEASGQIFNESLESRNQHLSGVDTVLKRSNQNPAEAQVKPLCPSPPEAAGIIRQQRGRLPDLQESTEKHLDLSNQTDRQSLSSCSWPSSPELDRGTERKSSCTEGQSRATTHNNNHIRIKGSEKDENAATPPAQGRMQLFALYNHTEELNTSLRFYSLRVPLQVQKEADNGVSSVDSVFIFQSSAEDATHTSYDAIVVEQWTVVDGVVVKTDYIPLLQSLAPYGWRLMCVLPTPIVKTNSDGSLSTKQILFLQRPVLQRKRKDFKMRNLRGRSKAKKKSTGETEEERENMSPLMETEMDRLRRNSKEEEEEEEEEGRKSGGSVRSEGGEEREEDTHHQRGFWFLSGSRASVEEQEEETDVDEIKLSELEESVRWTDVCRRSDGGVKEEGKTEERIKQQLFSGVC
ncbi:Raftlin [Dissostichus eleginoides]|uniref:Raftlin n=1 Tax=Dissostichus eleginoides TaxID=100907 RepID=A0AAD9BB73_DISEL|nr:Raftlin [Dissostichus eleginoides]